MEKSAANVSTSLYEKERRHSGTGLEFYFDFFAAGRVLAFDPDAPGAGFRDGPDRQRPTAQGAEHRGAVSAGSGPQRLRCGLAG